MKGAGEGTAADQLARLRMLGEQVRKRGGDLLEDFAVLIFGKRRRDTDVRDEKLALVAGAGAVVGYVVETAHREAGERRVALEERLNRRGDQLLHGSSVRTYLFPMRVPPRAHAAWVESCHGGTALAHA